jgi:glutathione S-transferase
MFFRNGKTPDADTITKTNEAFEFLNTFLEGQDWLAGSNITIADFAVVVSVSLTEVSIQFELSEIWFGEVYVNTLLTTHVYRE